MAGGRRFEALDDYLDDSLTLPAKGSDGKVREYTIPSPPAEDGLRVQRIMQSATRAVQAAQSNSEPQAADTAVLDDEAEADLFQLALSEDVFAQLKREVSWETLKRIAMTAVMWITADLETAEKFWTSGGTGGAPSQAAPNRAARRAAASSAGASATRTRGSTSGTKAQPRRQAGAASR